MPGLVAASRFPTPLEEAYQTGPRVRLVPNVPIRIQSSGEDAGEEARPEEGWPLLELGEEDATGLQFFPRELRTPLGYGLIATDETGFYVESRDADQDPLSALWVGYGTGPLATTDLVQIVRQSASPVTLFYIDGATSYDLVLLDIDLGSIIRATIFIPSTDPSELSAVLELYGIDPSWVVFHSNDPVYASTPGPLLVSGGAGENYTYISSVLDGTGVTLSGTTPTLIPGDETDTYVVSYFSFSFGGNLYKTTLEGGSLVANSIFFAPSLERPTSGEIAETGLRSGDMIAARTAGSARFATIAVGRGVGPEADSYQIRSYAPIQVSRFVPDTGDERWPGVYQLAAAGVIDGEDVPEWSTSPNIWSLEMGWAGSNDTDQTETDPPGYIVYLGAGRGASAYTESELYPEGGPALVLERPRAGSQPEFVEIADLPADTNMIWLGFAPKPDSVEPVFSPAEERHNVLLLGDFRLPIVPETGGVFLMDDAGAMGGGGAWELYEVPGGEPFHMWTPVRGQADLGASGFRPYTMMIGDVIGSTGPGLAFSSSQGLDGTGTTIPLGHTMFDVPIQAVLSPGAAPSFGAAAVQIGGQVSLTEVGISAYRLFSMGNRPVPIGATPPTVPVAPGQVSPGLDPRFREILLGPRGVAVGGRNGVGWDYNYSVEETASPGTYTGTRSRIELYRTQGVPIGTLPDGDEGYEHGATATHPGGTLADGDRAPYILLQSRDGASHYLWVRNNGELRVSSEAPEATDDLTYESRTVLGSGADAGSTAGSANPTSAPENDPVVYRATKNS